MHQQLRLLLRFGLHVLRRFHVDRCVQLASSLTFTTLLSIVPLVTVALTLVSAFPVFGSLLDHLQGFAMQNLLPEAGAKVISRYVEQFSDRAGRLTALGTLFLGVTAFTLVFTIERAFNGIWRVARSRPLAQRFMIYWAALTLGPVLIGASLSITSYLVGISLGYAHQIPLVADLLLRMVPLALTLAAFSLLYFIVPNRPVRLRHAVIGGLAAAVLFELMKRGFALYVTKVPTFAMVYGAFASVPIFLLWIYLSWLVVVLGAIIAATVPDYFNLRPGGKRPVGAIFGDALALLRELVRAQRGAQALTSEELAAAVRQPRDEVDALLERFAAAGWTVKSAGEKWVLACDPDMLRVAQVYREFVLRPEALREPGGTAPVDGLSATLAAGVDDMLSLSVAQWLARDDLSSAG